MVPTLHNVFKKIKIKGTFSSSFYETNMTLILKSDLTRQENYRSIYLMNIEARIPIKY